MKKINNKIKYLFSVVTVCILVLTTSCETTNLDVNVNPNELSPDSADPSLVLNTIQAGFIGQSFGLHANTRGVMREVNMFDTYASNTPSTALNGAWASTFQTSVNRQLLETLNNTQNLANHLGVAQVLEAFSYVNLVDYIGTAPYSEAVDPNIANPSFDSGKDIYDNMYLLLDKGIANLKVGGQIKFQDLFFDGDLNKWIKMANTLKIRMYVQSKLVNTPNAASAINSIISSGNYIKNTQDDFFAQFGTNNDNPDIRHPDYVFAYDTGVGQLYMSNEFMDLLLNDKTIEDPRLKHYIFRQTLADPVNTPSNTILPCEGNAAFTLCYVGQGYWGRMHGDSEGIPNDGNLKATFGAYPAGGAFDDGTNNTATLSASDLGGAGIYPVITSSFTNFLLAEASLPAPVGLGINGSTTAYLEAGIRDSFARVASVSGQPIANADAYVNEVLNNYAGATTDQQRLNIIIKEFFIASWGNSVESYNAYRRTGLPDLGGSPIPNTDFPRNYLIPDSELNTNDNPNLEQITRTTQVFWDTNPAGFVQ